MSKGRGGGVELGEGEMRELVGSQGLSSFNISSSKLSLGPKYRILASISVCDKNG
jgi:hypothetical protein